MTGVLTRGYRSWVGTGMPIVWATAGAAAGPSTLLPTSTARHAALAMRDLSRDMRARLRMGKTELNEARHTRTEPQPFPLIAHSPCRRADPLRARTLRATGCVSRDEDISGEIPFSPPVGWARERY